MRVKNSAEINITAWGDLFCHVIGDIYSGTANENSCFLTHGIRGGTQIFFDTKAPYAEGQLSCFYNKYLEFVVSKAMEPGFLYLGKLVALYAK